MRTGDRERKFSTSNFIPDGLVNSEYDNVLQEEDFFGQGDGEYIGIPPENNEDRIFPPEDFTVLSQSIRTLANGTQLVDIVVEVRDALPGLTYELRLARV